jgi:hypothetical protein
VTRGVTTAGDYDTRCVWRFFWPLGGSSNARKEGQVACPSQGCSARGLRGMSGDHPEGGGVMRGWFVCPTEK